MANKLYKPLLIDSIQAKTDLTEHRFAGFNGEHCTTGAKAFGVVDVSTEKGQFAPVAVSGILLVEAGEDITAGDEITSDADGKAIKAGRNDITNGYSLDTASTGALIRIVRGI